MKTLLSNTDKTNLKGVSKMNKSKLRTKVIAFALAATSLRSITAIGASAGNDNLRSVNASVAQKTEKADKADALGYWIIKHSGSKATANVQNSRILGYWLGD